MLLYGFGPNAHLPKNRGTIKEFNVNSIVFHMSLDAIFRFLCKHSDIEPRRKILNALFLIFNLRTIASTLSRTLNDATEGVIVALRKAQDGERM